MYAEEDKKRKEKVENKNKLDGMIFSVEQTMKEAGDKIDENDKIPEWYHDSPVIVTYTFFNLFPFIITEVFLTSIIICHFQFRVILRIWYIFISTIYIPLS